MYVKQLDARGEIASSLIKLAVEMQIFLAEKRILLSEETRKSLNESVQNDAYTFF